MFSMLNWNLIGMYGLILFLFLYLTWGVYVLVMNLIRTRDVLTWQCKVFAYPIAVVGILMDVALNVFVGTALFLELPNIRQLLFTARLDKHLAATSWRGGIAQWICHNLLDPFDPSGKHCKPN